VDITAEAMEVGPTCHYMMGGVRVDADTGAATVPGLYVAGEAAGGMHGSNRLGGNSLSDLLVFGYRAGIGASDFADGRSGNAVPNRAEIERSIAEALAPFERDEGENPYQLHHDLQDTMQDLVGIIRTGDELETALERLDELIFRASKAAVAGGRAYNPAWNLATDLPAMLTVSKCVTLGARDRRESRGGHTREDFPKADPEFGKVNLVQRQAAGGGVGEEIKIGPEPIPEMPPELQTLFEEDH
jgi:succinate dehydrogenase / fumarate reductase flavoprotein subunit